jgi:predicted RNA methylase
MLAPLRDVQTLTRYVRERGVRHTGRICALAVRGRWMAAADRRREAPFGISSEGHIELHELAIDSENHTLGFPYVPSPGRLIDALLFNIEEDLSRFNFIDFGSGKGRVLLVASHYPFRQVVGVEFSPELHEIAKENIRRYQNPARRCQAVHSICADAATFALPEHACVLYFNNPFAGPILA